MTAAGRMCSVHAANICINICVHVYVCVSCGAQLCIGVDDCGSSWHSGGGGSQPQVNIFISAYGGIICIRVALMAILTTNLVVIKTVLGSEQLV